MHVGTGCVVAWHSLCRLLAWLPRVSQAAWTQSLASYACPAPARFQGPCSPVRRTREMTPALLLLPSGPAAAAGRQPQPHQRALSHYSASTSAALLGRQPQAASTRCCAGSADQPEFRGNARAEPAAEAEEQAPEEPAAPPRAPLQSRLAESEVTQLLHPAPPPAPVGPPVRPGAV